MGPSHTLPNEIRYAAGAAFCVLLLCTLCQSTCAAGTSGQNVCVIDELGDADGAQVADIDGDGDLDVAAASSRYRGRPSKIYWYQQEEGPRDWTRHPIYSGSALKKVEGIDAHDFDGDGTPEVFALDQTGGRVVIFRAGADGPTGRWNMSVLDDDCWRAQDSMVADIAGDGTPELIYTWEGSKPGTGGIKSLSYSGGPVTDPENWKVAGLVRHMGAWWLCSSGRLDVNDDGRKDIVFGARGRNKTPNPGVFWLEAPEADGGKWTEHVIDDSLNSVLNLDSGDFDGDGDARDIVVQAGPFRHAYVYTHPGWKRTKLPLPASGQVWNVRRTPYLSGGRHGVLVTIARDHTYVMEWDGNEWNGTRLFANDHPHPLDDRIIYADMTGDGFPEAVIPDSGGNRLLWVSFGPVRD